MIDHSTKATDYYWCRPWIADRGWGADSLLQTAGLLKWLLDDIEDGGERVEAVDTLPDAASGDGPVASAEERDEHGVGGNRA